MPDPAPVTAVPRRMRQVCAGAAAVVVVVMGFVALTLPSSSTGVVAFGAADQLAIAGLGLAIGAGLLALGRSRVDADTQGIRWRNVAGQHELPWSAVRAVAFDRKSAWATLRLENDDEVALFAVQAVDKEHALRAVEGLRALRAAARANDPVPPPLLYDD
ncbi:MAG TPA: PH domain-containing protein [Blastococcus sp.]|nr:PH domain-containing protein [Blastococcus sp.]